MPSVTLEERKATTRLIKKCRIYLDENFHKFSEDNRIKISMALLQKAIPTQLEHSGQIEGAPTKVIVLYAKPSNTNTESRIPAS